MRPFLAASLASIVLIASAVGALADPDFWKREWPKTDFDKSSVPFIEIMSGGPPKDGIPALDPKELTFAPATDDAEIADVEPVVTVELNGEVKTYPIRYLTWHEIANDVVGGEPVTVTFCPLCNSAIVFSGRIEGQDGIFTFGVSGKLRNSDMVMYDRNTESWWQQFTGEGIVGELNGVQLTFVPSIMESFAEFRSRHPDGLVMQKPTTAVRPYGSNPYARYDSSSRPFLYQGENPPHDIEPLARVVRVGDQAWPLSRLRDAEEVTEAGVRITWKAGQASALDDRTIANGRDVGTIRVYDAATGDPVVYEVVFAFAFHAFEPDGTWHIGSDG